MVLLDRVGERKALDRLLDEVRGGLSRTLVIRGEAGIGKTALLEHLVETTSDFRVVTVTGVEAELSLDLAGLHQLLVPFLSRLNDLPSPQRGALGRAFGLADGAAPDRFMVGLGVLTLLSEAAVEQPVLVVLDDAQWLDHGSAQIIAFAARRMYADRIAFLIAVREPIQRHGWLEGFPQLGLSGLADDDAKDLLRSVGVSQLEKRAQNELLATAVGNPLALIELSRALTPLELEGRVPLGDPLRLGERLEQQFLLQVRELPADTQGLLLLLASEPSGDAALILRAAAALGIDEQAAAPAEAARLISLEPTVTFRHPLIRSAVYHGAVASERRRVHDALAGATDPSNVDRYAWHRAASAQFPDESVAAGLEASAVRVRDRGGYSPSVALLVRAAELTPDPAGRSRRLLAAAQDALLSGAPDQAMALLEAAAPTRSDPLQRARAVRLEGAIVYARGEAARSVPIFLASAAAFEPLDDRLTTETLLEALAATLYAGGAAVSAFVDSARVVESDDNSVVALLLRGLTLRLTDGYVAAVPSLRQAVDAFRVDELSLEKQLLGLELALLAAYELFADEAGWALAQQAAEWARAKGMLTLLPFALVVLAAYEILGGEFGRAEASLAESREISAATGNPGIEAGGDSATAYFLASAGREPAARTALARYRSFAVQRRQEHHRLYANYVTGVLELGLGNYEAALAATRAVYEEDPVGLGTVVLPDLVEAAVHAGDRAVAQAGLERLEQRAAATRTELALGLLARSRALVLDDERAERLYEEAADHIRRSTAGLEAARTHLLYGEWLRRKRRRRDAREQLNAAHELFDGIGAQAFAERARGELLATGGRARKRAIETRDELTPQEGQVARLASEGASNREIAAHLFISPNTVAYHLRKAFRKLDVSNRTQLGRVLADEIDPHQPTGSPPP